MSYYYLFWIPLAYILGSIPSAVWIGKALHGVDVREHGSHNAGATNTVRTLGWPTGLLVLAMDMAKGWFPTFMALRAGAETPYCDLVGIAVATAALFGHLFPLFAGFKGGKGVATLGGALLAIEPFAALSALGVFALLFASLRRVSVGSMGAAVSLPLFMAIYRQGNWILLLYSSCITLLVLVTHRSNIGRLFRGEEARLVLRRHRG